jgi:hypothetical protein
VVVVALTALNYHARQPLTYESRGSVVLTVETGSLSEANAAAVARALVSTTEILTLTMDAALSGQRLSGAQARDCDVSVVNRGNQWSQVTDTPSLVVACRGGSAARAQSTMIEVFEQLTSTLVRWQDAAGVPPTGRVSGRLVGATVEGTATYSDRPRLLIGSVLLFLLFLIMPSRPRRRAMATRI